jgi:hypothetical protein
VAILQISRITQRKGLKTDLPEPLAGAELGWAVDTRQLYIGNGELAEGAPAVGNTEVLTEFSDLLSYVTGYTYQGDAGGYTVQTGATSGSPVTQSIQSRLDSYAIVTDFGATGDGVTDDTAAINRALYQLYCRQSNPQVRRSLFFPAGTYLVTDTILIPPFAKLYGEGAHSSTIYFQVNDWVPLTAYAEGVLVYYVADGNYYRSLSNVPAEDPASAGSSIAPTNTTYWQLNQSSIVPGNLPEYVVRTADSLQQTGVDIGTNGATPPQDVEISSMGFATVNSANDSSSSHNICLIEDIDTMSITDANFTGPFTVADSSTASENLSCVRFASTGSLPCTQINITGCTFSGATYGINTDQVIKGCTISNGYFNVLYQGVVLDTATTGVRIVENIFDNIFHEGILITGATLNASAYNIFYDVGNIFLGIVTTPVIEFDTDNNISIGDLFERNTADSTSHPRVALNNTGSVVLGMNIRGVSYLINGVANDTIANQMQLGEYTRTTGVADVLTDAATQDLFVVNTGLSDPITAFKVDYTITRNTSYRNGTMNIVSGTAFTYSDDYAENSPTGITLLAAQAGGNVTVSYTSSSTGIAGAIKYSITHLS